MRILADRGVSGEVLLPPRRMKVLTMYTVDAFPVVPREWFIENIDEPEANNNARRLLYQLASGELPLPNKENSADALGLLESTSRAPACCSTHRVMKYYAAAGYTEKSTYGTFSCAPPPRLNSCLKRPLRGRPRTLSLASPVGAVNCAQEPPDRKQ